MPSMAMCTKLLKKVAELVDPIDLVKLIIITLP